MNLALKPTLLEKELNQRNMKYIEQATIYAATSIISITCAIAIIALWPSTVLNLTILVLIAWVGVFFIYKTAINWRASQRELAILARYNAIRDQLVHQMHKGSANQLDKYVIDEIPKHLSNPLVDALISTNKHTIESCIIEKKQYELLQKLSSQVTKITQGLVHQKQKKKKEHPVRKALNKFDSIIPFLERRHIQLEAECEAAYKTCTWWDKLNHDGFPMLKELEDKLAEAKSARTRFLAQYESRLANIDTHYDDSCNRALERLKKSEFNALRYIHHVESKDTDIENLLRSSYWLAILSIPISLWDDFLTAGNVYDALRRVHSGFENMSDFEIWRSTLSMPQESLVGLASLTKGAYFEQLVASNTGGQLHEHFNHPNTDIVIDGTEYQIKVTDSASYINSVVEGLPIIATSEVTDATRAIDSGIENAQITRDIELALGGSVVDVSDTAIDSVLSASIGLGTFATIRGFNHAVQKYEKGGDAEQAIGEGLELAITETARAAVNTAELGYKVATSAPMRGLYKATVWGAKKIDKKLSG